MHQKFVGRLSGLALLAGLAACSAGVRAPEVQPELQAQAEDIAYRRILVSSDDAEEAQNGYVRLDSPDLDLGLSKLDEPTTVGLRFADLAIPPGATITEAHVSFIPAETRSTAATLTFRGQGTSDTGTFSATTNNLTTRPLTAASVSWNVPAWTASTTFPGNGSGQSASLKAIVQEIVSKSDWASGNAINFLITGSGKRLAHTFESTGKSPALFVRFTAGTTPTPRTSFPTKVNPSFTTANILDAKTRDYYNRLLSRIEVDNSVTSCAGIPETSGFADGIRSWNTIACANNSYIYGRMFQGHIAGLLDIFRLTGDLRLLKEVDRLMELARSKLGNVGGWRQWKPKIGQNTNSLSEWSERFLDDVLAHALVARVASALQDNAGVPGTSFGTHAQAWRTYLTGSGGYEQKIKQVRGSAFPFIAGAPYGLGQSSNWNTDFGSAHLAHIYVNHIMYLHYVGKLTGSSAYAAEATEMLNYWTRLKVDNVVDAYVWSHATILPDAEPTAKEGRLTFAPIVYSAMTINTARDLALDGQPFFDSEAKMARFSRTVSHHILDENKFNSGNRTEPYRDSIGSNRSNWKYGAGCDKTTDPKIFARSDDKCVDIGGVRFIEGNSGNSPDLPEGAYNYISAWPKKPSLAALESSKIYGFHAAAYDPNEPKYNGVKALIFSRLWVEGGYTLN